MTPAGAAALEHLSGTDGFTEGDTAQGKPNTFSVSLAASRIQSGFENRIQCRVYKVKDKSGFPLLDIDFEPRKEKPGSSTNRVVTYPVATYAYTNGESGAYIYFACPTEGDEGKGSFVKASMFINAGQASAGSTGKDRMTVLNDVSRAVARELGCAAEAKLPTEIPEPLTG